MSNFLKGIENQFDVLIATANPRWITRRVNSLYRDILTGLHDGIIGYEKQEELCQRLSNICERFGWKKPEWR